MDDFYHAYDEALEWFQGLTWGVGDMLGGALLALAVLAFLRLVVRALIFSWLGETSGKIISLLVEVCASLFIGASLYQNPGTLLVVLGWSAALFRQVWCQFRF